MNGGQCSDGWRPRVGTAGVSAPGACRYSTSALLNLKNVATITFVVNDKVMAATGTSDLTGRLLVGGWGCRFGRARYDYVARSAVGVPAPEILALLI